MPRVEPFKGIRYNPERITSLADVVSPPYDVIAAGEQAALHARSPYNVIRMELGEKRVGDDPNDNPHTRAGEYFRSWLAEGTLLQEAAPALYLTATEFEAAGAATTRWGLLARVRLQPFQEGGILPHERTFSNVKSERLSLMRACRANLSPIFSFFTDKASTFTRLTSHVANADPAMDFRDHNGHRHRLWVIKDPHLHRLVAQNLGAQPLFIADGHHRYETALAYRDELAHARGGLPEDHPANYTLMYLSRIEDPGLIILPTHRLLPEVAPGIRRTFLERAAALFDLESIDASGKEGQAEVALMARLEQTRPGEGLAVALRGAASPVLLQLKSGIKETIYPQETLGMMKGLDVTLLTEVVFPKLLGLSPTQLDDVDRVHYAHNARAALDSVTSGQYEMAFILKPPLISSVQRIADAGQVMPRKSTYFAPKVITGLVMHAL